MTEDEKDTLRSDTATAERGVAVRIAIPVLVISASEPGLGMMQTCLAAGGGLMLGLALLVVIVRKSRRARHPWEIRATLVNNSNWANDERGQRLRGSLHVRGHYVAWIPRQGSQSEYDINSTQISIVEVRGTFIQRRYVRLANSAGVQSFFVSAFAESLRLHRGLERIQTVEIASRRSA